MGDPEQTDSKLKTGESHPLVLSQVNIELAIEIDPTAGLKTKADLELGDRSGRLLMEMHEGRLRKVSDRGIVTNGNRHSLTLRDVDCVNNSLENLCVTLKPQKGGLLKTYDKDSGKTVFREDADVYPTASLRAQIILFRGDFCLTGETKTFDELAKDLQKSDAGINRILIRLDKKEEAKILDCLIDGVIYWKNGKQVVTTA